MTIRSLINHFLHKMKSCLRNVSGQIQLKESITGLGECKTPYLPIAIFDLNNIQLTEQGDLIELRSFEFGASSDAANPSLATFAIQNNIAYNNTSFFLKDIRDNLKRQSNKPTVVIDGPALLLPYYTTHFGHFTGECLGTIISLSKVKQLEGRKLFYIAPNSFEPIINQYGNLERLQKIDSKLAYENNVIFTNASLLPRLSPWQNLSLCSQIFSSLDTPLPENLAPPKKVFLTSGRPSRIQNIDEVINYLEVKDFYICRPDQIPFEQCLRIIRDAECLISENGSITHNLLISRIKPFNILASADWKKLSPEEFAGGGIYNSYKSYLANYIECKTTNTMSHHAFSDQLVVNLTDMDKLV